jgi:SnoaL-like domain
MDVRLEDRAEIADLMSGWIHRDLGEWDELRNLFHDDATIEITWFDGTAGEFPLRGEFPTRGSKLEIAMTRAGTDWLNGALRT